MTHHVVAGTQFDANRILSGENLTHDLWLGPRVVGFQFLDLIVLAAESSWARTWWSKPRTWSLSDAHSGQIRALDRSGPHADPPRPCHHAKGPTVSWLNAIKASRRGVPRWCIRCTTTAILSEFVLIPTSD